MTLAVIRSRVRPACTLLAVLATFAVAPRLGAQAAAAGDQAGPASLRRVLDSASRAVAAGEHRQARHALGVAHRLAPGNGSILYYLARAQALTGDTAGAVRTLERLAYLGAVRDVVADSAFAPLRTGPHAARLQAVARRLSAAATPIVRSDTALVIADPDFIPEGLAYDPSRRELYVGSLHGRGVLRVSRDGTVAPFLRGSRDTLDQVLGIRVDTTRRRLWLAALVRDSAAPRFAAGVGGWSALHAYDLRTGRLLARYPVPDSTRPHLLNDVAITPDGDVYVTDSEGDAVYRLRSRAPSLERLRIDVPGFMYPNGVAVSADGRRVYVADMAGMSVLDHGPSAHPSRGPRVVRLSVPTGISAGGIDGLYSCGRDLLAIQSFLDFQQVTRFRLTPDGRGIVSAEAVERRHPAHNAATTGALVDGTLLYIANAQLRRLAPSGELRPAPEPTRSLVLRLPLNRPCGV